MTERIFDGEFTYEEHHFYANKLDGVGAETTLHYHDHPHVALFHPGEPAGGVEYRVFAIQSDGTEREMPLNEWGYCYIAAKIQHRVQLSKGNRGAFVCMFSRWGPDGFRPDPKLYTGAAP